MTLAIANSTSDALARVAASGTTDSTLAQLASMVARLAMEDSSSAAQVVRDIFAAQPASANAETATAIASNLDDQALGALAATPIGRDFLGLLDQRVGSADLFQDQMSRVRDALLASGQPSANDGLQAFKHFFGAEQFRNAQQAVTQARPTRAGTPEEQVKSAFKEEFAAKAANKEEFDEFMHQVYGDNYDKDLAEQYRQRALAGDFAWLPKVEFVDAETLQGGKGAYNEAEGVVYINRDIAASDPELAAQVFVEEAGAHLDAKLNTVDTQGDEGEMFRRVLSGEQLSAQAIAAIRADDDHGTITVDGKQVQVEFWFGEDLVDAAGDVVDGVVEGAKEVGEGIVGAATDFGKGVFEMTGGFVSNLVEGDIGEAFDSVIRGADHAIFQSTERLYTGVIRGAKKVVNGVAKALGPIGKPLREVSDRFFDMAETALTTIWGVGRDAFRWIPSVFTGFVGDVERAVKLAADGRWGDAAKQFGMAFVNTPGRIVGPGVDMVARVLQGGASMFQTAVGLEPPARGLTADERKYLESIYGDSIDYDMIRIKQGGALNNAMAPHTVGNTIYMPKGKFGPDGKLTKEGLETLGHEAGHVWQNQNGGGDYIHNSLGSQLVSMVTDGKRGQAYDWRKALGNGESFESMNDEQRAKVMEDIGIALRNDGQIKAQDGVRGADTTDMSDDKPAYTDAELAFLRETAEKLKFGEGAS
jgi:hypothetical protein